MGNSGYLHALRHLPHLPLAAVESLGAQNLVDRVVELEGVPGSAIAVLTDWPTAPEGADVPNQLVVFLKSIAKRRRTVNSANVLKVIQSFMPEAQVETITTWLATLTRSQIASHSPLSTLFVIEANQLPPAEVLAVLIEAGFVMADISEKRQSQQVADIRGTYVYT